MDWIVSHNLNHIVYTIYSKKSQSPPKGPLVPPPPPPDAVPGRGGIFKSRSWSPNNKATKSGLPPPDFDLANVNTKIAKPEDYNEIQFKAVDPMALRRQQKLKGTHISVHVILFLSESDTVEFGLYHMYKICNLLFS